MSLTVTVNNEEVTVPEDFGATPQEFAEAAGYNADREWNVYRTGDLRDGARLTDDDRCSEPMVVSDGDEFAIIPRYTTDG